jgi:hypothetical protein
VSASSDQEYTPRSSLRAVILLLPIVIAPLAIIVVGYRNLAAASSPQAARGVLLIMIGVGALLLLWDNITW